ncbi:MAG TPA: class I tRNA ligase family protein [Trebonia sp.]
MSAASRVAAGRDERLELVVIGPPTANGDLHVGHVAGPCAGADVRVRYLRAAGRPVVFASGVDDSQTFVVTAAARLGTTPAELAATSWHQIKGTFEAMAIGLDGFAPNDDAYRALVYRYVGGLYDLGKFRTRTVPLPYSERTGKFLVEGLVGGDCPTCLADSRGGFCEACGHPIDFGALIEPYSIMDRTDKVTFRDCEILVFPVEEYREQLIAYYAARETRMRPHPIALMRELLARPLPDYPVTYPVDWGLPAPFPETPGQRINAWLEGMPASMYDISFAQRQLGLDPPADDDAWRAEHGNRLVVFMGFDPLWVWGVVHVAELMAHEGRYVLPDNLLCNEFCDLENEKFSTSKGHVVWARDLVAEVPRDVVRFYVCLTAPEHARTNFSRAALDKVAAQRLVDPWNDLVTALTKLTAEVGDGPLPVSAQTPAMAAAMVTRFGLCFELATFSLSRASELIAQNVERLRAHAQRALAQDLDADTLRVRLGDLFLQVRALVCCAAPVLVDLAAEAATAGGFELRASAAAFEVTRTAAFAVPRLSMRAR